MKDFYNDNFKKLKEKLSKEKGTISKCDFAESINKIVTSAIGAMVFFNNMDLAFEIAALKTNEAMDELFPEEPSPEAYGRFKALQCLVMDAGLEEKYNFWKAVNGYE